jgi:hypothetical protein
VTVQEYGTRVLRARCHLEGRMPLAMKVAIAVKSSMSVGGSGTTVRSRPVRAPLEAGLPVAVSNIWAELPHDGKDNKNNTPSDFGVYVGVIEILQSEA